MALVFPITEMHLLLLTITMLSIVVSSYWMWKAKKDFVDKNLTSFVEWLATGIFLIAVDFVLHFLLEVTGFIQGELLDYLLYTFIIFAAFCFARASMHLEELYKESDFMSLVKERMQNQQTEEFFDEAKK
ncbi:MAG: hypothetical protein ABH986_00890 [archaeon]